MAKLKVRYIWEAYLSFKIILYVFLKVIKYTTQCGYKILLIYTGEPNNGNEGCGHLVYRIDGKWSDTTCESTLGSICKKTGNKS